MARMYPAQISPHTDSPAERLLFQELERQLPNSWIAMHGVGWLVRNHRRDQHGEADFVIVHPDWGVLVLEVKGGVIRGDWASDDWVSISRGGHRNDIRNPFRQADRSRWTLLQKLRESPRTNRYQYQVVAGVAFPDMLVGDAEFGIDADRSLVLDSSDLGDLETTLTRMLGRQSLRQRLGREAVSGLVQLIQPVVEIERRGLVAELLEGEAHIVRLTGEQRAILGILQHQRRAVIDGCAGSGKTMLAMEKAVQLAADGFDVLLTCYNRNLANWMASVIEREPAGVASRVLVRHYHDLAVRFCEEAGLPTTVRPDDPEYWNIDLPIDLLNAIPRLQTRFDAIVADEGQDFDASWWETLLELLRDPDDGVFYIFRDQRQDIYHRDPALPFPALPFALQGNLRNSEAIHRRVTQYWEGDPKPAARGPAGRPVELIDPGGASPLPALRDTLRRLIAEEGVRPDQIVVLTPNSQANSALREGDLMGRQGLTWSPAPEPSQVRVSSIHGFKGLESDIVILVETERLAGSRSGQRLSYVALSRPRHHLIVIGQLPPPVSPAG